MSGAAGRRRRAHATANSDGGRKTEVARQREVGESDLESGPEEPAADQEMSNSLMKRPSQGELVRGP